MTMKIREDEALVGDVCTESAVVISNVKLQFRHSKTFSTFGEEAFYAETYQEAKIPEREINREFEFRTVEGKIGSTNTVTTVLFGNRVGLSAICVYLSNHTSVIVYFS